MDTARLYGDLDNEESVAQANVGGRAQAETNRWKKEDDYRRMVKTITPDKVSESLDHDELDDELGQTTYDKRIEAARRAKKGGASLKTQDSVAKDVSKVPVNSLLEVPAKSLISQENIEVEEPTEPVVFKAPALSKTGEIEISDGWTHVQIPVQLLTALAKLKVYGSAQLAATMISEWRPRRPAVFLSADEAHRRIGLSERAYRRAMRELRDSGLLQRSGEYRQGKTCQRYTIPALEEQYRARLGTHAQLGTDMTCPDRHPFSS